MTRRPASVTEATEGALPVLRVHGPAADAVVHLQGAQVTAWAPHGDGPVLWHSPRARLEPGVAVRAGVPLCFPWFGPHPAPGAPSHGFARVARWSPLDAADDGEDVVVRLRLEDDAATRGSAWPHRFAAVVSVRVGRTLSVALEVTNRDDHEVTVEAALHTYLAVRDVRRTTVAGLEGVPYLDKPSGGARREGEPGPVRFAGEVDRVYPGTTATTTVDDGDRRLAVAKTGSATTVVWNPGPARGAALADVADDWPSFVCVEAAAVGDDAVHLAPGASHVLGTELSVVG